MGKVVSKILGNDEVRILMLGLDTSGKTCILTQTVLSLCHVPLVVFSAKNILLYRIDMIHGVILEN